MNEIQMKFTAQVAPLDRWDVDAPLGGNALRAPTGRFGGFVLDWAGFDAAAFGVSGAEAALMDPQQRVLLEARTASALSFARAVCSRACASRACSRRQKHRTKSLA